MALFGFGVDRTTLYETFDSKSRVMPSALSARAVASSALPAQAGIAECGQVVEQGDGLAEVLGRAGVVLVIPFRSSRSPTSCSASSASTPSSSADSATSTGLSACLRTQLRRLRYAVQRVLSGRGHAKRGHDGWVPDTSAADWRALRVVASGHAWRQSVVERVGRRVDAHIRS